MVNLSDAWFEEHLEETLVPLTRLAMALTLNKSDAEDLVQQVVLRMHQKRQLVSRADNGVAYAIRMLINEHRSVLRHRRREQSRLLRLAVRRENTEPENVDGLVEHRLLLIESLQALPERQRIALTMRYLLDRPDTEIAAALRCTEGTVRSLVKRGLDSLRRDREATITEESELRHG